MWYSIVKEKQRAKQKQTTGFAETVNGLTIQYRFQRARHSEVSREVFLIYHRQIGGHSIYPTLGTLQFSRRAGSSDT